MCHTAIEMTIATVITLLVSISFYGIYLKWKYPFFRASMDNFTSYLMAGKGFTFFLMTYHAGYRGEVTH